MKIGLKFMKQSEVALFINIFSKTTILSDFTLAHMWMADTPCKFEVKLHSSSCSKERLLTLLKQQTKLFNQICFTFYFKHPDCSEYVAINIIMLPSYLLII